MSQFIYNEHGACENPILKTYKCSKGYEAQVETAIVQDELWGYGVRFNGMSEGWSHTFFRGNRSALDIIESAKVWNGNVYDDSKNYNYQIDMFEENESCEVFSNCGDK